MKTKTNKIVPVEIIESKIWMLRGKKVILDRDLAMLYDVETRTLIQAVKRNIERFPEDFMFQLTKQEADFLRSQIVILEGNHFRYLPYAFTEYGILMLSSVLNSEVAIQINIQIMRIFTRIRQSILSQQEIKKELDEIKQKYSQKLLKQDVRLDMHAVLIDGIVKDINKINEMLTPDVVSKEIGFRDREK